MPIKQYNQLINNLKQHSAIAVFRVADFEKGKIEMIRWDRQGVYIEDSSENTITPAGTQFDDALSGHSALEINLHNGFVIICFSSFHSITITITHPERPQFKLAASAELTGSYLALVHRVLQKLDTESLTVKHEEDIQTNGNFTLYDDQPKKLNYTEFKKICDQVIGKPLWELILESSQMKIKAKSLMTSRLPVSNNNNKTEMVSYIKKSVPMPEPINFASIETIQHIETLSMSNAVAASKLLIKHRDFQYTIFAPKFNELLADPKLQTAFCIAYKRFKQEVDDGIFLRCRKVIESDEFKFNLSQDQTHGHFILKLLEFIKDKQKLHDIIKKILEATNSNNSPRMFPSTLRFELNDFLVISLKKLAAGDYFVTAPSNNDLQSDHKPSISYLSSTK